MPKMPHEKTRKNTPYTLKEIEFPWWEDSETMFNSINDVLKSEAEKHLTRILEKQRIAESQRDQDLGVFYEGQIDWIRHFFNIENGGNQK